MTREGPFSWELDIPNMKSDELEALITACNRARHEAKRIELSERMDQLIADADAIGCHFSVPNAHGTWTRLIPEGVYLNDNPKLQLEV